MAPGSMRTSTRLTATRLPNRLVTWCVSRSAIGRQEGPDTASREGIGRPGPSPRCLLELQCRRLALADGNELAVLDLDQGPLLDRVAGMLAVDHVDHGDLAVGAGEAGEILDGGQRLAHLLAVRLEALRRVGDVRRLDRLGQHLHGVVAVCGWPMRRLVGNLGEQSS